jgi:hypothetical protein
MVQHHVSLFGLVAAEATRLCSMQDRHLCSKGQVQNTTRGAVLQARAHTLTQADTLANASLSPAPFLSVAARSRRGRHKGECAAAARAGTRTAAKPTADQLRVLKTLNQLDGVADWRSVAAQERAARAVAATARTSMPGKAAWVYCILGNAYESWGTMSRPSSTTHSNWRSQGGG